MWGIRVNAFGEPWMWVVDLNMRPISFPTAEAAERYMKLVWPTAVEKNNARVEELPDVSQ